MKKRLGILTGGGDVPGLNSVIKGVVYRATAADYEVYGIRRGWEGLTHVNLASPESREHYILPLDRINTRTIDRTGGTYLHTSRTNPSKMVRLPDFLKDNPFPTGSRTKDGVTTTTYDVTSQVLRNLNELGIERLIAIGGDDTLSYAAHLAAAGVDVIAIPKTMDNDVQDTEYCIGFSTAITRAMAAIERQLTTVASHERIGIFRIFGRDAGYSALYTAYVTGLRCAIPEHEFELDHLITLLLRDKGKNPSNYSMVVLSEGARWRGYVTREYGEPDAFGHRKKVNVGEHLSDELKARASVETIVSDLTYDLRGGEADFVDKLIGMTFGNMAVDCVLEGRAGLMMAMVDGRFERVKIPHADRGPRRVDVGSMYDVERCRPTYAGKCGLPLFLTRLEAAVFG
jgi:6-phosphofructokinase 1